MQEKVGAGGGRPIIELGIQVRGSVSGLPSSWTLHHGQDSLSLQAAVRIGVEEDWKGKLRQNPGHSG